MVGEFARTESVSTRSRLRHERYRVVPCEALTQRTAECRGMDSKRTGCSSSQSRKSKPTNFRELVRVSARLAIKHHEHWCRSPMGRERTATGCGLARETDSAKPRFIRRLDRGNG